MFVFGCLCVLGGGRGGGEVSVCLCVFMGMCMDVCVFPNLQVLVSWENIEFRLEINAEPG